MKRLMERFLFSKYVPRFIKRLGLTVYLAWCELVTFVTHDEVA